MKKILTIFAFAALLTGCGDFYGPNPKENDPISGKGATITVDPALIGDTGFTAEIASEERDVFCSYVLCKENQPSKLDPNAVLKCTVAAVKCNFTATVLSAAGDTLDVKALETARGTFNAGRIVLEFGKLEQNTTYQLYAVAASKTGLPGEVVSKTVLTTDSRTPKQTAAGSFDSDSTLTITFSQPVSFVKGSEVKVSVFAENTNQFLQAKSVGYYGLADDDVVVGEDGKTVEINFHPDTYLPAGAYFTVNYPDGAFVSDTGVPCKGCSAAFTYDEKGEEVIAVDEDGTALTVFNGSRVEPTTFEFIVPEATELFEPLPTEFEFIQDGKIAPVAVYDSKALVEYSYGDESKSTTLNLAYGKGWDFNMDEAGTAVTGITVSLPELPAAPGVDISITIPEGIFADAYGNTSEATSWTAKFVQLDEIGTGLFSEPAFLEIENQEATLFYNPSTDVYRIADCFAPGYHLEFKWDRQTNKCEIIGRQDTGWLYAEGVGILVCDAHGYYSKNTWEEIEGAGYKHPYYENGAFVFPDVAYVLTNGQATKPQFTITFNMGRDITKVQLEGIWSCASVTDYWGDSYGPFNIAILQNEDKSGAVIENEYIVVNLAPYLATMGVTAQTVATYNPEKKQLVIAFGESSGISAGGTPIVYKGYDNADPDEAEYYDDIYFSVSAIPATMVNLNAYGLFTTGAYELYYGGAMQLKRTADLPVTTSNCVETRAAQIGSLAPKSSKNFSLESRKGSFQKKGMAAFLQPASKERKLK